MKKQSETGEDVTDKTCVERERDAIGQRLQRFSDSLPMIAWECAANGDVIWFNRRFRELSGIDPEAALGWGWVVVFHPDDLADIERSWRAALAAGTDYAQEVRLRMADGKACWHLLRTRPERDAQGRISAWYGTAVDIDDRKRAEERLAESESRFRGLADNMSQLAWIADREGRVSWYNRRWLEYTGASFEDQRGFGWHATQHPDHIERVAEKIRRAFADDEAWEDTFPLRGADGRYRWFLSRATPERDEEGKAVRWFGTNTDITDQREVAIALQASEERLAAAIAQAHMGTFLVEFPDQRMHWDKRMCELFGLKGMREVSLAQGRAAVHPDDRAHVDARFAAALDPSGDGAYEAESRLVGIDDGVVRWVHTVARVKFADGQPRRMVGHTVEIGERKAAEAAQAALLEQERHNSERLRLLAEASLSINAAAQGGDVLATVAKAARRLIPAHQSLAVSQIDGDWAAAFQHADFSEKYVRYRGGRPPPVSGWQRRVCESNRPLRLNQAELEAHPDWAPLPEDAPPLRGCLKVPLVGGGGRNLGLIQLSDRVAGEFSADDEALLSQLAAIAAVAIENSRLYAQLREADRRKDEFLATLAHELRNPLAPIKSALQVLQRRRDAPTLDRSLALMDRQADHMVRLVDDLLEVSRITRGKIELKREPVDLVEVLHSVLETTLPRMDAARHRLSVELSQAPLPVDADAVRLAQVFTNLLNNAAKYTPAGGEVRFSARREGDEAVVGVADNGIGIPEEMLPRVFDLFAQVDRSLRGAQEGLGIGLSIVKRLVEMHGGSVAARSRGVGQGAEFEVRLKLSARAPLAPPQPVPQDPVLPSPILVVDDNRDAADSLGSLLDLLGSRAQVYYDGASALAGLEALRPAAALLDLGMPDVDGFELARRIRAHPQGASIRLIALSGWGQAEDRRRSRDAGFDAHIVKPVDIEALQSLLAGGGGSFDFGEL